MNPYEILDIADDATIDEIKKAYKNKAKDSHPDKGGSNEEFVVINECYLILSTPNRKKRYDETGNTEPEISFEKEFQAFIQSVLIPMIQSNDVDHTDLIGELKKYITDQERGINKNIDAEEKALKKTMNVKRRLKSSGDGLIHAVIDLQIAHSNIMIQSCHEQIGLLHRCQQTLEGYKYEVDEREENELQYITFNLAGI